jgi:hypothetical protein
VDNYVFCAKLPEGYFPLLSAYAQQGVFGSFRPACGGIKWQREAADRTIRLMSTLTSDEAEAQRQFGACEEQTARTLGLNATVA